MKLCGIEAGGTKFVLGIGDENGNILIRESIPTLDPETTLEAVSRFILKHRPDAVGIASFGPVDLNPDSPTYGEITSTPKPHWANTPILRYLSSRYDVPYGFDTDVNAAAVGESLWGNGRGVDSLLYLTVGTGIGGGLVINGQTVHGLLHPEMGHILLQPYPGETFLGVCPFHKGCFEGLASGPAIERRWGTPAANLSFDHPAWDLQAFYIGQALMSYILTVSPQRIILGGGVMHQEQLFPKIRGRVKTLLNGYLQHPSILKQRDDYIMAPGLGDDAGLCGALALAMRALER
ncbi:MAG: fructokinase [Firmicutes bacterium GWF2_51_9]|nr:MAG: fructokinase [Firmicutes bacterium GWF2_51_9]OGS59501.1 MAG: fructokinase [Firmicutes bacterium GWE2_51_13]HAO61064.1 fructokinase [Erysipelotrichaceae bacterium]HBZ41126.1 fructokinase [Erysipelotrichaceae bacterium]